MNGEEEYLNSFREFRIPFAIHPNRLCGISLVEVSLSVSKDKRQVFWPFRQGPLDCPLVLGDAGRERAEDSLIQRSRGALGGHPQISAVEAEEDIRSSPIASP